MFSRKKPEPPKRKARSGDLSQFGLFDIPDNLEGVDNDDDGNDSDLEAELAAINAGGGGRPKPKPKPKPVPAVDLDSMVAASMMEYGSDEELSGDDDDPDLLNELSEIAGVEIEEKTPSPEEEISAPIIPTSSVNIADVIKTRIEMYSLAEENSKLASDSGKARRFNRGLKTLKDFLKQANAGKPINIDDLPPEVSTKPVQPVPVQVEQPTPIRTAPPPPISPKEEPEIPVTPVINPQIAMLNSRKLEYKTAALTAKKSGDTVTALQFIKVVKQFDSVIKAIESGQEVDLSNMPPPASEYTPPVEHKPVVVPEPQKEESEVQNSNEEPEEELPEEVLITASTVMEALQQRLDKYKSVEQAAKDEGNTSKARRFGRIIKQYEDAIKAQKAGRTVAYDELPCPPGFGPIPLDGPPKPKPPPTPVPQMKPTSPQPSTSDEVKPDVPPRAPLRRMDSRASGNHVGTTHMEKQLAILLDRQKEFKEAAIAAKKSGDIEQAKEYLKIFKGFDSVINAASGGMPVDMATLPIPPSQRSNLEDSFTIVATDDLDEVTVRLEEQLQKQLTMCKTTRDHLRALGDVAGTNRFENLAIGVQKDLDFIRLASRKNYPIPKFHYETKNVNIVKSNTDLTDNEVEINVTRGINYNVPNPKDIDTYVKIEFPWTQDEPFKTKTIVVKNEDNPEYNHTNVVEIQRSNRTCQRIFKRQSLKLEVFSKGCWLMNWECCRTLFSCRSGFLRSDVLIGTVLVKLQPLETASEIHDSFDLMDGRKKVGGKLEVKIRLRNPIIAKQVEQINEKWLIIDS